MSLVELIAKKRDGHEHSAAEVRRLISAFTAEELTDYQLAAWLMAVFFRGMSDAETVALTEAMLHSGDVLDFSDIPGSKVDKHSTGGVGDKVSLCLAPLVAACGVKVPMVSGRGLGHTGGTLDKLEAIPGFNVTLDEPTFRRIVRDVGTAMIGQTSRIAPADKRIYALRDVTATVESVPLIVASILSKKLAEGIDGLVLDVKVGRGAFMKSREAAETLARALVRVGVAAGKRVSALLTRMDTPLGLTIGNANETREAFEVLAGGGPADLVECTLALGEEMLLVGGAAPDRAGARKLLETAISSGKALAVMERMVEAQGGDAKTVAKPELLAEAEETVEVRADRAGFVSAVDPLELGLTAVAMGAGRTRADQKVDPGVGIRLEKKPGAEVREGDVLATLRVRRTSDANTERVKQAFTIAEAPPASEPLVIARIEGN